MKSDESEIKPAYKNPLMEHYECDGQISLFDYWDEALKYNETKDDCDGQINIFRYLDK
mgnify:CR=1 FL=1